MKTSDLNINDLYAYAHGARLIGVQCVRVLAVNQKRRGMGNGWRRGPEQSNGVQVRFMKTEGITPRNRVDVIRPSKIWMKWETFLAQNKANETREACRKTESKRKREHRGQLLHKINQLFGIELDNMPRQNRDRPDFVELSVSNLETIIERMESA